MKKIFYLVTLVIFSSLFVQCEKESNGKGIHEGYEYVDLGLSVKWATCNIGADSPERYGKFFAWGEVKSKDYYDWNTYKYCKGVDSTFTKYCNNILFGLNGFTDGKTILDLEDDAAHVNWGGNWRMPTAKEQQELYNKCKWIWTEQNYTRGYKIVGINGNSIFLPAAGSMGGDLLQTPNEIGYYWSNTLATEDEYDETNQAKCIRISDRSVQPNLSLTRRFGFPIRAVCP